MRVTAILVVIVSLPTAVASAASHPLDPLSAEEISAVVEVLKASGKAPEGALFPSIALNEPPKDEVLAYKPGEPMRREAFAMVYERAANKVSEAIVDLNRRTLVSWKEAPGARPPIKFSDIQFVEKVVRADPQWQEAMRKRGITDLKRVAMDPWPGGYYGLPEDRQGLRFVHVVFFNNAGTVNQYARPIEGLTAYVDLAAGRIFKLVDTGVVPVPKKTSDFDEKSAGKLREPLKPLEISQPRGAGFEVSGNEVRWQNWRFRFAMHPRVGVVLYQVHYQDGDRLRSVLYRASLSEMVVPYAGAGPHWFFRNVFDTGEYFLGWQIGSLEPLTDAPANAVFFDSVIAGDDGQPIRLSQNVALWERDGGILWKHFDGQAHKNESRRARELVLMWIATVGNYDYGFSWIFHQDGTLEMELGLTGIMQPKVVASSGTPAAGSGHDGHLVADSIVAVHHQHFLNFRLDMDVDGADNSVVEIDTVPSPPGSSNPYNSAFAAHEKVLRTEQEAERQLNLATARRWKVINPSEKNALGQPTGYLLVPGENSLSYAAPDSPVRRRAGFLNAHLWVTQYNPAELYAAGDYVSQSEGGEGLPQYVRGNRPIQNQDVVLWYTVGITHVTRPEDWPVMPVHRAGFKLMPSGFFSQNPALDVPRPRMK